MKKESLSIIAVKMLLAVLLFAGIGTIIIGGGYIIGEYSKNRIENKITKPVDQEMKNYYDVLEKKCDDSCCLSSLKTMRANNYKEADKDGRCPEGFYMNMMKCITSYQWCVLIGENCTEEGRLLSLEEGLEGLPCCDGLSQRIHYDLIGNECALLEDTAICINCPNGKCDARENKCNCPEDCGEKVDTSDWQTYRNEEFGFEVKYPEEWSIREEYENDDLFLVDFVFNISKLDDEVFNVAIFKDKSMEEIVENGKNWKGTVKADDVLLFNRKTVKVTQKRPCGPGQIIPENYGSLNTFYILNYNEKTYRIGLFPGTCNRDWNKYTDDILDQILSTFKFIEN